MLSPSSLLKIEQRHRPHRVLMHAVDRIALDDASIAGIVVPPPLPGRPLKLTDTRRARFGRAQCSLIVARRVQTSESLDWVNLICVATDVGAQASAG